MTKKEFQRNLKLHAEWLKDNTKGMQLLYGDIVEEFPGDLHNINLSRARMARANLQGKDISGSDLSGSCLYKAYLYEADLSGANLSGADLSYADLAGADMTGADMTGADLTGACLRGAFIDRSQIPQTIVAPLAGSFEGWKKVRNGHGYYIVHLFIPSDARRSNATTRQCRAEFVDVLELYKEGSEKPISKRCLGHSAYCDTVIYRKGLRVTADFWDDDWRQVCTHGIHFFMTRQEAEEYYF